LIVLAAHEWLAGGLGALACALRLWRAHPWERSRFFLTLALGLCMEVALWRTTAIVYNTPATMHVPFWILPLWGWGGLFVSALVASQGPRLSLGWLGLLPFAANLVLPSSLAASLGASALAIGFTAYAAGWRRALAVAIVGLGGSSASMSFGLSGVCSFPQAVWVIPPWGPGLWTTLTVTLLSLLDYPFLYVSPERAPEPVSPPRSAR
jgi:hypothetical protein